MCSFRIGNSKVKNIASQPHKTGTWYFLGVFFKFLNGYPRGFYMGASPPALETMTRTCALASLQALRVWFSYDYKASGIIKVLV